MNKSVGLVSLPVVSCLFISGLMWMCAGSSAYNVSQAEPSSHQEQTPLSRFGEIEDKAKAPGGDPEQVRELADAVLSASGLDGVPAEILTPLRERLVRAEVGYRSGRDGGVREENVVRLINDLARKFDAPEYAKTDGAEVRSLREMYSQYMPHFIPSEHGREGAGRDIKPMMSPLEATFIARSMVNQKLHNEWFQLLPGERASVNSSLQKLEHDGLNLTPEERAAVGLALVEQLLRKDGPQLTPEALARRVRERSKARPEGAEEFRLSSTSTPRQEEMQAVIGRASSISMKDAVSLAQNSLDILGID